MKHVYALIPIDTQIFIYYIRGARTGTNYDRSFELEDVKIRKIMNIIQYILMFKIPVLIFHYTTCMNMKYHLVSDFFEIF